MGEAQEAPAARFPICAGCGLAADARLAACSTCYEPYPRPPRLSEPSRDGGFWAAVRVTFTCNMCRFEVPLNHFVPGDSVTCLRCGLEQRYEAANWSRLVRFAHAVGDLGRDARRLVEADPDWSTQMSMFGWVVDGAMRAAAGNPLCASCKAPRVVTERLGHTLVVSCTRCSDRRTYEGFAQLRCAGVLADEHEEGHREAVVQGGAVALLACPNCSAPLEGVGEGDTLVTCAYCHAPCRISRETHARFGHKEPPAKTWWLYFDRPSERRAELARRAEERARDEQAKERLRADSSAARQRREQEAAESTARDTKRTHVATAALCAVTAALHGAALVDVDRVAGLLVMAACALLGAGPAAAALIFGRRVLLARTGDASGERVAERTSAWWLALLPIPGGSLIVSLYTAIVLFRGKLSEQIYGIETPGSSRTVSFDAVDVGRGGWPLAWFFVVYGLYVLGVQLTVLAILL